MRIKSLAPAAIIAACLVSPVGAQPTQGTNSKNPDAGDSGSMAASGPHGKMKKNPTTKASAPMGHEATDMNTARGGSVAASASTGKTMPAGVGKSPGIGSSGAGR